MFKKKNIDKLYRNPVIIIALPNYFPRNRNNFEIKKLEHHVAIKKFNERVPPPHELNAKMKLYDGEIHIDTFNARIPQEKKATVFHLDNTKRQRIH